MDGSYIDSFQDAINFVSVNIRKLYKDQPAFTKSLLYNLSELKAGKTTQSVAYPRLAVATDDWQEYEYQVRWSLRNGATLSIPPDESKWIRTRDAAVSLVPPFEKRTVIIESDRQLFAERGIATAVVEFATYLGGKKKLERKTILRAKDSSSSQDLTIYLDRDKPMAARVSWYGAQGKEEGRLVLVEQDFLNLTPPTSLMKSPVSNSGGSIAPSLPTAPSSFTTPSSAGGATTSTTAIPSSQNAGGSSTMQPEKPSTSMSPGPGSLDGGR